MAKRPPIEQDLSHATCIVTGASSGVGKEIARSFARMGATVVLASHDFGRGEAACSELAVEQQSRERLQFMTLDLCKRSSIRDFVDEFKERHNKVDILVHCAAVYLPKKFESADGFDRVWMTNVLGPHVLMGYLRRTLEASAPARVVFVTCADAGGLEVDDPDFDRRAYSGAKAYKQSKQAQRMLSALWADRLSLFGVSVNAAIPGGNIKTGLYRYTSGLGVTMARLTAVSPAVAADTPVWLATSPELQAVSGKLFQDRKQIKEKFRRPDEMTALWGVLDRQLMHLGGVDLTVDAHGPRETSGLFDAGSMSKQVNRGQSSPMSAFPSSPLNQIPSSPLNSFPSSPLNQIPSTASQSSPLNQVASSSQSSPLHQVASTSQSSPLNQVTASSSSAHGRVSEELGASQSGPRPSASGAAYSAERSGGHAQLNVNAAEVEEVEELDELEPEAGDEAAGGEFTPAYLDSSEENLEASNAVFVPALMRERVKGGEAKKTSELVPEPVVRAPISLDSLTTQDKREAPKKLDYGFLDKLSKPGSGSGS